MPYTPRETSDCVYLEPLQAASAAVIWLHGLGADGHDFVPIVEELRLPDSLPVRFVFPHAQPRPITINNGYVMRAWYDITGFGPGRTEDEAGVRDSEGVLTRYIEGEIAGGLAANRIVIAGFSQGGAIALHTALRHPQPLGGVLALSTYLPISAAAAREAVPASRESPILMCHGTRDPMVPYALGEASRDALRALGCEVEWRSYPMEHQVCLEQVADLSSWLVQRLARNL